MDEWKMGWMINDNEWMSGWMDEWVSGWVGEWMDEWMDVKNGCEEWMNGWWHTSTRR